MGTIGIIPAAGQATRMNGIPKFLLPTPNGSLIDLLISKMTAVGQYIIMTSAVNAPLLKSHPFVYQVDTQTMCQTLLSCPVSRSANILFGMPDTFFEDDQAFVKLSDALADGADVAVGLFKVRPEQRSKLGMCDIEGDRVKFIVDKPAVTDLEWAWSVLAWKPILWRYIKPSDPTIGCALQRCINVKLDVRAVLMDGPYWDCGTPDEYFALIRRLTEVRDAVR